MKGFEEGYSFLAKNAGALYSANVGREYVSDVNAEVSKLVNDLNAFKGYETKVGALKGDIAEFWHSDSFNISAVLKGSDSRTFVDRSHDFASADITSNFGDKYGLKYYQNGAESAKAQSVSFFQRFKEYKGPDDFEEFLKKRGYTDVEDILHKPIYQGQKRLIPSDQLEETIKWLEQKIAKEETIRPEQVQRYKDTLEMLCDRIDDGKGVQSKTLTKEEAEHLARLAKEGKIDAKELNMTAQELITYEYILEQSFQAGLTSATISLVLKLAPELLKTIEYLIENGAIDSDRFKELGLAALDGSAQGFFCGSVSAALTIACKAGHLGTSMTSVSPSVIGAVTAIVYNTIFNSMKVVAGKMTRQELTNELIRQMIVSTCSLVGAGITQSFIEIPVLGFMLGSFVGSAVGSFVYDFGYSAVLSFCVDTGFTMFGLVEQNYKIPDEVLERLGIKLFDYEKYNYQKYDYKKYNFKQYKFKKHQYAEYDIVLLRRGVIGVNRIGYV